MKIGIILALIGVGLLGGAYLSYSQIPANVQTDQQIQASYKQWQTTFILGIPGLLLFSIGVGTIKSAIRRKAMGYVQNKVGGTMNSIGGGLFSQFMSAARPSSNKPQSPDAKPPENPPKGGQT